MKVILYRFGCLRRVANGEVDITVLEPEELMAIRNYKLYNVLVTNELRLFSDGNYYKIKNYEKHIKCLNFVDLNFNH